MLAIFCVLVFLLSASVSVSVISSGVVSFIISAIVSVSMTREAEMPSCKAAS